MQWVKMILVVECSCRLWNSDAELVARHLRFILSPGRLVVFCMERERLCTQLSQRWRTHFQPTQWTHKEILFMKLLYMCGKASHLTALRAQDRYVFVPISQSPWPSWCHAAAIGWHMFCMMVYIGCIDVVHWLFMHEQSTNHISLIKQA